MSRPMKSDSYRRTRCCKHRTSHYGHRRLKVIANLSFNRSRAFGLGIAGSSRRSGGSLSSSVWVRGIKKGRPIYGHTSDAREWAWKVHFG